MRAPSARGRWTAALRAVAAWAPSAAIKSVGYSRGRSAQRRSTTLVRAAATTAPDRPRGRPVDPPRVRDRNHWLINVIGALAPVLQAEPDDVGEVLGIVGDEYDTQRQRMRRNQGVHLANRNPRIRKGCADRAESLRGGTVEWSHLDCGDEGVDCSMNLARASTVGTESQLGEGNRADAKLRRTAARNLMCNSAMPTQREAHRVGVEEESGHELTRRDREAS